MGISPTTTKRRVSKKLFQYIGAEFLIPLTGCVTVFLGLFVLMDILDTLKNIMASDVPVIRATMFLLTRQAVNVKFILPMSMLLGASFMMHRLSRHGEIIALRGAGISLCNACLPVWLLALILSAGAGWLNETFIQQEAMSTEEALQHMLTGKHQTDSTRRSLTYINHKDHRHWFFGEFRKNNVHTGVRVKQFRPDESIKWEIRAQRVLYRSNTWIFRDGERVQYRPDDLLPTGQPETFDELRVETFYETPAKIADTIQPTEKMSTLEILRMLRQEHAVPPTRRSEFTTVVAHRLTFPFASLMGAILGIGFSVSPERASALKGFAISVMIIMLYYFIDQAAFTLGRMGYLPAFVGGSLTTLLFITVGITRMVRIR